MITINGVPQKSMAIWDRLQMDDELFVSKVHATRRELILKARKVFPGAKAEDTAAGTIIYCQDIPSKRPYARRTDAQRSIEKRKAQRRKWHREQIAAPAIDPFS